MNTTCENAPESKEYLDFVEKFKPKKTTDGRFQNASSKSLEN